jgi:hypothetical protein
MKPFRPFPSLHASAFVALLFTIASFFSCPLAAQTTLPTPGPSPEARRDDFVTDKNFRSAVFEVKHREASDLAAVLRPLGSGFKGATVSANNEFRTISVRDFPENIAAIGEAVKRLDVAEPAKADVDLLIYELAPAIAALHKTMPYRSYELAAVFTQRVRDGSRNAGGEGTAEIADLGPKGDKRVMQAEYRTSRLSIDASGTAPTVKLEGFALALSGGGRAQVRTDVSLRAGEKVVVGTSTMQDKGLVVVLSATPVAPR